MKEKLIDLYANVLVKVGLNNKPGQLVVVLGSVECASFVRKVVKAAYANKAGMVEVRWMDDEIMKDFIKNASFETLAEFPEFKTKELEYFMAKGGCAISIISSSPDAFEGLPREKLFYMQNAQKEKLLPIKNYMMKDKSQWVGAGYPSPAWAHYVFPAEPVEKAQEMLLEAILKSCRIDKEDPVAEWKMHLEALARHNMILNKYNFKSLCFKNSLGTDLEVGLVKNHVWQGGYSHTLAEKIPFVPNMPTEESYTMPDKYNVNGKVYASKPLSFQGNVIRDFYFEFKDGKVVDFDAKAGKEILKAMLAVDSGSSRLGEVALISDDSPINKMNILFYNTLYDENAGCHLALGNAYLSNLKDGINYMDEELDKLGCNKSMIHVDFIFGTKDLEVIGKTYDNREIHIFKKGNFIL